MEAGIEALGHLTCRCAGAALWYRRGVRIAGWIVVGAVAMALLNTGAAVAGNGSSQTGGAAVDIYVEKVPTARGAVPADHTGIGAGAGAGSVGSTTTAGTSGGLIWFALVLVGVTVGVVLVRVRGRDDRR